MRIKSLTQRFLPLLLSFVLVFSSFPIAVLAEEQPQTPPWAADAVEVLNEIYGVNTFSGNNAYATVVDIRDLLVVKFRYPGDHEIIEKYLDSGVNLSRLQAVQVVYSIYNLYRLVGDPNAGAFEDCNDPAAATLRSLGIINGKAEGIFAPNDPITNAELAVVFYRVLRSIGTIDGITSVINIKPGQYGYDEIMYLYTRACVPKDINPDANLSGATLSVVQKVYSGKKDIWEAWGTRLASLPEPRTVSWSVYDSTYVAAANTIRDAAVIIVAEDRAALNNDKNITGIFSDVGQPWLYDGVMYLFSKGIVNGLGDGRFAPFNSLTRKELATLVCRINNININDLDAVKDIVISDVASSHWSYGPAAHAIKNGYMAYTEGTNFEPDKIITRQEAAEAVFRSYKGFQAENVNLSVLERFKDSSEVKYKTSMAYLVSAGIVRGTAEGKVEPERAITRGEFGVLLARVLMGLDRSKMHDYETVVTEVLKR